MAATVTHSTFHAFAGRAKAYFWNVVDVDGAVKHDSGSGLG
jgi:hypothetical protein